MIINFYQTIRRHIPEDSILHIHCPEIQVYRICRYYNEHCDLMIQQVIGNKQIRILACNQQIEPLYWLQGERLEGPWNGEVRPNERQGK